MREFLGPVLTLAWKDILLEVRSKDVVVSVLVFGFLVVVVFNFALNVTPMVIDDLAPGILWVAFAFAGVLAMSRAFVLEKDRGSLEGLMLTPVSRDAIYLGKMLGIFLFMLVVEAVLLPVFGVLFSFSSFTPGLFAAILLATLGFAMLFSAWSLGFWLRAGRRHSRGRMSTWPVTRQAVLIATGVTALAMMAINRTANAGAVMLVIVVIVAAELVIRRMRLPQ